MTLRSRMLANKLDAAIDGRDIELPDELVPLVAIADAIRAAAQRIDVSPAPVRVRIQPDLAAEHADIRIIRQPEPRGRGLSHWAGCVDHGPGAGSGR